MSTNVSAEVLQRMLDRMTGGACASRVQPATGAMACLSIKPKAASVYDVTEAEMMADPANTMSRFLPEDRAELDKRMEHSLRTLAPMSWIGRLRRRDGEIRWLETQTS